MFHKAKSLSDSKALTLSLYALLQNHFKEFQELTSQFEWTLDDIRIEKIISALIWATIFFFLTVSALLDAKHCPKLQSCAISRKTKDAALRKRQKL